MSKHLQRDLDALKKQLVYVGSLVEEAINFAMIALLDRREEISEQVINSDSRIDAQEIEMEENCLKVLALHQPMAGDLRFIVSVLKVNMDLERMGDMAVNIAQRAKYLSRQDPLGATIDFELMVEKVRNMVRKSLDALVNLDTVTARQVVAADDEVDELNKQMFDVLQDMMRKDATLVERAVDTLSASRHLERIADLATNIAEDVVFMVDGEVIRHG